MDAIDCPTLEVVETLGTVVEVLHTFAVVRGTKVESATLVLPELTDLLSGDLNCRTQRPIKANGGKAYPSICPQSSEGIRVGCHWVWLPTGKFGQLFC